MRAILLALSLIATGAHAVTYCVVVADGDYAACPGSPVNWREHLPAGAFFGSTNCTGVNTPAETCSWTDANVVPTSTATPSTLTVVDRFLANLILPFKSTGSGTAATHAIARVQTADGTGPADFNKSGTPATTPAVPGTVAGDTSYNSASARFGHHQTVAEFAQFLADVNTCFASGPVNGHCSGGSAAAWTALTYAQQAAQVTAWADAGRPYGAGRPYYRRSSEIASGTEGNQTRYAINQISAACPTCDGTPFRAGGSSYYAYTEMKCSDAAAVLNTATGECTSSASLRDGYCDYYLVDGSYQLNNFDPDAGDCQAAAISNSATAATVTLTTPAGTTEIRRDRTTGDYSVREYIPDISTNTTRERELTLPANPANPASISDSVKPGLYAGAGSAGVAPLPQVLATPGQGTSDAVAAGVRKGLSTDSETTLGDDLSSHAGTADARDDALSFIADFSRITVADRAQLSCTTALDTSDYSVRLPVIDYDATFNLADTCEFIEPHESFIKTAMAAVWLIVAIFMFVRLTI